MLGATNHGEAPLRNELCLELFYIDLMAAFLHAHDDNEGLPCAARRHSIAFQSAVTNFAQAGVAKVFQRRRLLDRLLAAAGRDPVCSEPGCGKLRLIVSLSLARIASRPRTDRSVQPLYVSLLRRRTAFFVVSSTNTAMDSFSPITVPISESSGFCGAAGLGGNPTAGGGGEPITAGAGGRRDGEKIGRSRVLESCLSGMAHNGLGGNSRLPESSGGAVGAAGLGLASVPSSRLGCSTSGEIARTKASACSEASRTAISKAQRCPIIADPAIGPRPKLAHATCRARLRSLRLRRSQAPGLPVGQPAETAFQLPDRKVAAARRAAPARN